MTAIKRLVRRRAAGIIGPKPTRPKRRAKEEVRTMTAQHAAIEGTPLCPAIGADVEGVDLG